MAGGKFPIPNRTLTFEINNLDNNPMNNYLSVWL